jgi:hypothetical protein
MRDEQYNRDEVAVAESGMRGSDGLNLLRA